MNKVFAISSSVALTLLALAGCSSTSTESSQNSGSSELSAVAWDYDPGDCWDTMSAPERTARYEEQFGLGGLGGGCIQTGTFQLPIIWTMDETIVALNSDGEWIDLTTEVCATDFQVPEDVARDWRERMSYQGDVGSVSEIQESIAESFADNCELRILGSTVTPSQTPSITAAVGSESSAVKCGNVEYAHNVIANRLTCVQAKEMLRNWVESGQPIEQLGEWARYEIHPLDVPSYASYVGPGEGRAYVSYEVKM